MNRSDFAASIHVLEKAMGKKLDPDALEIWYRCFNDLTAEQLQSGIVAYLRDGDDWPSIAKLRRFAGVSSAVDGETRAEKAWVTVLSVRPCTRFGRGGPK